jgi:hypothetical protein
MNDFHRLSIASMIPTYVSFLFCHSILLLSMTQVPRTLVVYVIVVTAGGENGGLFIGAFAGKSHPVIHHFRQLDSSSVLAVLTWLGLPLDLITIMHSCRI